MKLKFISLSLIAGLAGSLMAFYTPIEQPNAKIIISTVGNMLKSMHYEPQQINDDFSKKLFINYLDKLDAEKKIFLQSDIDFLKKYELTIDDEITGKQPLAFLAAIDSVLDLRIIQAQKNYSKAINELLNLNEQAFFQLDQKKLTYAMSEQENEDFWRKSIKYNILLRLDELQDIQKNAKSTDPIANQDESDLLKQAKEKTKRKFDKYFNQLSTTLSTPVRFEMFVNCIATTMDPHSTYMAPITERSWSESVSGTFGGLGIVMKEDDDYVKIESIVDGGPAWKQGALKAGDLIMKVSEEGKEQVDVAGFTVNELRKLTRGAIGSTVIFTVKGIGGNIKTVSLVREELKHEGIFAHSYIINGSHKIGMIVLPEFYLNRKDPKGPGSSAYDVAREIEKLKAAQVEGIVIDLRFNGGGSLTDVVNIAGLFIPQGPIVQIRARDGNSYILEDTDANVAYDGPLAVMVNEYSASASEILAAAMQDYKRAVIIGSAMTFGKGTVQRLFELKQFLPQNGQNLGAMRLTIQKFYRINGSSTQLKGVTPDIILKDQYTDIAEKSEKAVLNWDEITPTDYTTWTKELNVAFLRKNSEERVALNPAFVRIEKDIAAMEKWKENRLISLEQSAFIAKRKADKAEFLAFNQEMELHKVVDIVNLDPTAQQSEMAKERNKRSLEKYGADHYLAESIRVMNDMIETEKKSNF
ncbi:carboxy terminal-processing peptidase [Sphingobacterium lumbrici]|uniref:carboxy terminal-processing peptidase n=1 Tax=Sphingobacterium lumbrici TaxID=2559600 RepID=UPI00112AD16C|nr:carboxy terminal-processing peptidase [Sphingobacterium lumbrici]